MQYQFERIFILTLKQFEMRKFLLSMFAGILAVSAYPAEISDYCGDFQCKYLDEFKLPKILPITIAQSETEGKIAITGLYSPAGSAPATIEADIDLTAGTVTIPCVTLKSAVLYRGTWKDGKVTDYSLDPIIANLVDGNIVFNENDVMMFGVFDPDPEYCAAYSVLRRIKISPATDLEFVYNKDEWSRIGTAQYPDCVLGYKIFGTIDPIVSTVDVVQNKSNPNRIALLNPYKTDTWKNVNRDQESIGQIVIDMSDRDFVVFEPYVYSGFTYNLDGINYGKIYIYNMEGYFAKIGEMTKEEIRELYLSTGYEPEFTRFDGNQIIGALGAIIFATESKPTAQYQMGPDRQGSIVFDDDAITALKGVGVSLVGASEEAPAEYYDLMGNKVTHPQQGTIYICRKGGVSTKVIL